MKRFLGLGSVKRFSNDRRIMPTIVVHGGAGDMFEDINEVKRDGVKAAALIGYDVLLDSGCVVEAVHEAVRILEIFSRLNITRDTNLLMEINSLELEASIMRGNDLNCGAISGVANIFHPISLARLVMERTHLKKLSGGNAIRFATENRFEFRPKDTLIHNTDSLLNLDSHTNHIPKTCEPFGSPVGAVAIDYDGNIAAASSGTSIGSGVYADNFNGGVSVSSPSKTIREHKTASRILAMIQCQQLSAKEATAKVLGNLKKKLKQTAGAVCIDVNGNIGIHFTTLYMPWAYRQDSDFHCGMEQGEDEVINIEYSMKV